MFRRVVSHSSSRSFDVITLGEKGDTLTTQPRTLRHIPQDSNLCITNMKKLYSARGKFWEVAYSLWNDLYVWFVCVCVRARMCVRARARRSIDLKKKC